MIPVAAHLAKRRLSCMFQYLMLGSCVALSGCITARPVFKETGEVRETVFSSKAIDLTVSEIKARDGVLGVRVAVEVENSGERHFPYDEKPTKEIGPGLRGEDGEDRYLFATMMPTNALAKLGAAGVFLLLPAAAVGLGVDVVGLAVMPIQLIFYAAKDAEDLPTKIGPHYRSEDFQRHSVLRAIRVADCRLTLSGVKCPIVGAVGTAFLAKIPSLIRDLLDREPDRMSVRGTVTVLGLNRSISVEREVLESSWR